jgi:uncharacterized oligopeptide transporter (OPT) family protein
VVHGGGIYWSTPNLSPALIGIGYIIGPELSAVNASGGVLAWWVLIPLLLFFDPDLPHRLGAAQNAGWDVHFVLRLVQHRAAHRRGHHAGGRVQHAVLDARLHRRIHRGAFGASAKAAHEGAAIERTDRDIPFQWLAIGVRRCWWWRSPSSITCSRGLAGGHRCRRHHDGGGLSCSPPWADTWWGWWAARTSRSRG